MSNIVEHELRYTHANMPGICANRSVSGLIRLWSARQVGVAETLTISRDATMMDYAIGERYVARWIRCVVEIVT